MGMSEEPKSTLQRLIELQSSMGEVPALENLIACYDRARSIRSDFEFDGQTTKRERALLDQLDRGLSDAIAQVREAYPSPSTHSARVAASALQSSLERRTVGLDGYPLRR
jgi:hypothetical protein